MMKNLNFIGNRKKTTESSKEDITILNCEKVDSNNTMVCYTHLGSKEKCNCETKYTLGKVLELKGFYEKVSEINKAITKSSLYSLDPSVTERVKFYEGVLKNK